ncbi:restriction endonuclease subunit S [Parabacteroides sp. D26]|uniref:restriction endonuclease subunit S n=1 Tax=Parabacteroides sp. D26 TaxID=658662 RepID=UPI003561575A
MAIDNKDKKVLNVPPLRFPEFSGEWKKCTIGELAIKVGSGVTPRGGESVYKMDGHPFVRSQNVGLGHLILDDIAFIDEETHLRQKSTELKLEDVLLNITGASIGRSALVNEQVVGGNVNQHVCIIRTKESLIPSFLCNFLLSNYGQRQIDSFQAGGNRQGLNFEQIKSIKIAIPSTKEQTKVAKLLQLIEERIATQNKIIEKLQSLIKGLIDDIITLKCGQLVAFETLYSKAGEGGTPTTSNTEFYDNGSIPFIKIDDLSNKYLSANKDYITELGLKKSSAWLIPTHSIIYSNGATIGAISINKYPVCTKQGILGIVPNTNIDVEFLYYFMQSSYFQKEVERVVTEGTMKTAYLKDINHIKCPIPDLDRQKEISHLLSVLSLKEDVERQLLQKYQIQKQYLLRKMFI